MPKKLKVTQMEKKETSLKTDVYNLEGKVVGKIQLPPEIFAAKANSQLIAQAVRVYRANQRLGTHSVKTRSEVAGSTRKIYRQKGTGRARHGAVKAPIFIGGGVAHGPKQHDYSLNLPQGMKRAALFTALTSKLEEEKLKIITGLDRLEPKTKKMFETLTNLKLNGTKKKTRFNTLLVLPEKLQNIMFAARNIPGVDMISAKLLNTYGVLAHRDILFMKEALAVLEANFLPKEKKEKKVSGIKAEEPQVKKENLKSEKIDKKESNKQKTETKRVVRKKKAEKK